MASDSRVSEGNVAVQQVRSKLYLVDGTIIGCSGEVPPDRLITTLIDWRDPAGWDVEIDRHAKAVGATDFDLLIGRGARIWYWEGSGCYETGRYAALGSGCAVCLGYLAGTVGVPPKERVRGAVRAAIEHVPSCGGKIWDNCSKS
jgi:20S proteasome alpha/beta subunit